MSTNCSFSENGLFRVHLFGEMTRAQVTTAEICRVFDEITEHWDLSKESEYLDIIFRSKSMPSSEHAITWPNQKSTSTYLWMSSDVSTPEKKNFALHELRTRFGINDYDLRNHNRVKDHQSCFLTDNGLFAVHLLGDDAVSKLSRSNLRLAINDEANRLIRDLPGSTIDVIIEHISRPIHIGGQTATGIVQFVKKGIHYLPILIRIQVNLFEINPVEVIIQDIRKVLRHELHHYRFFESGQRTDRLLDQLIYEGLAVAYEVKLDPENVPAYADAVNRNELIELWQLALPKLHHSGLYDEWFHGRGDLPRWAGYTLGYEIVKFFLDHNPGYKVSDLLHIPSDDYVAYVKF